MQSAVLTPGFHCPTPALLRRRSLLRGALAFTPAALHAAPGKRAPRVVFLNPGSPDEDVIGPLWPTMTRLMQRAAEQLGMALEVSYAGLDRGRLLAQARAIARRPDPPDYLVTVNSKESGAELIALLAPTRVRILLIHADLTAGQRREIGGERERYPNWIGTVVPDDARGSHRLMARLYELLAEQRGQALPQVIGITGQQVEPVSLERARGVQSFIDAAGRGRTLQVVYGDYSFVEGELMAQVLLARYPQANLLWAANDTMALGALRAVRAVQATRGRAPVLVGGMGGWPEALRSIAQGGLAATVEGHYLIGAIALVLLHDYHRGLDFAAHGGALQRLDYLRVRDQAQLASAGPTLFERAAQLDFRAASRLLRPRPGAPQRFSLDGWLGASP